VPIDLNHIAADCFTPQWVKDRHGSDELEVSDLRNDKKKTMSLARYFACEKAIQRQRQKYSFDNGKLKLLYLKSLQCPDWWQSLLQNNLPDSVFSTKKHEIQISDEIGPASDLINSLFEDGNFEDAARPAASLKTYIGYEGIFSPIHHEKCATVGPNLMLYASPHNLDARGYQSFRGSSIWFMTAHHDRHIVAEYLRSHLQGDVELENHILSIED
jgi:hypothetical protein